MQLRHGTIGRRAAALLALVALLAVLAGPPVVRAQQPRATVTLTMWSWVPNIQSVLNLYNKTHSGVVVQLTNKLCCTDSYKALRNALKAGQGAPDVSQIEFDALPTFESVGGLADLSKYGAAPALAPFAAWERNQVSSGSAIYAIPQDSAPIGLYYRADLFKKYGAPAPTTWSQFAKDAAILHKADPNLYIANFSAVAGDAAWFVGLVWQAGGKMFHKDGDTWKVTINNAAAKQVANYWGDLIKKGLVKVNEPYFSNDWNADLDKSHLATWIAPVWGANTIMSNATHTTGWRMAPMPQWKSGGYVAGDWGGSTTVVTTQSAHPKEAAAFAIWLNTNQAALSGLIKAAQIWPASAQGQKLPALSQPLKFYGGQSLVTVFKKANSVVDQNFEWSPVNDFFFAKMGDDIGLAVRGQTSWSGALDQLQQQVVGFMQAQGFKVG